MGPSDHRRHTLTITTPLLVVDALVAGYTQPTMGPVSFTIAGGEVVGLAGPNGAGKSTILNTITGESRIFGGRVTCDRADGVSVLRQFPVRLPEMPLVGRELLDVTGASALPVPSAVTPLIDLRLDRLSGGQYQLLLVWACLGSSARLVLLDEPTNNMDPETVVALGEMLLAARDRGKGVLVVSHEAGLLERVCSRIVEVAR